MPEAVPALYTLGAAGASQAGAAGGGDTRVGATGAGLAAAWA